MNIDDVKKLKAGDSVIHNDTTAYKVVGVAADGKQFVIESNYLGRLYIVELERFYLYEPNNFFQLNTTYKWASGGKTRYTVTDIREVKGKKFAWAEGTGYTYNVGDDMVTLTQGDFSSLVIDES